MFDLTEADSENWLLIGGQMIYLLAIENGVQPVRATDDLDVVVDVRSKQGGTEWLKAAATTISVRTNRERDWEDAALLLSVLADPFGVLEECSKGDMKRLRLLGKLNDSQHPAWRGLGTQAAVRGRDALGFLLS